MPIVTQTRAIAPTKLVGKTYFNGVVVESFNDQSYSGGQTTTSYRSKKGVDIQQAGEDEYSMLSGADLGKNMWSEYRRRFDTGHEFSTQKSFHDVPFTGQSAGSSVSFTFKLASNSGTLRYTGCMQPVVTGNVGATLTVPSSNQITKDGTAAINATIPTAPEAGLAQFLGELREGIPKLTGTIARKSGLNPTSVSEEYLNREFGVKPFIGDLTKFANAVIEGNKLLAQYRRDGGRNVRRRRVLADQTRSEVVSSGGSGIVYPRLYSGAYPMVENGRLTIVDEFHDRVWFSGAYTYHVAEMDSLLSNMERFEQQANHLLGTRITPDLVWELTPWSWLVDWFSNFGQIVQNISWLSQDSTVLRYGYIMHETRATRTRTVTGLRGSYTLDPLPPVISSFTQYSKKRTRATPYGFGVNVSNLSPRRWAILGALGITKGSNSLRLSD
jgi:hypothetical protein